MPNWTYLGMTWMKFTGCQIGKVRKCCESKWCHVVNHVNVFYAEKPTTQFVEEVREIISEECNSKTGWIFCGNYTPVQTMLMDNCDYILWLDYPIWRLVLPRLLYRTFRRVFFNEPCCNGNYETFYLACCTRFSIVYWLFQSYWKIQDKYNNMMSMTSENVNKQKFIKLKSDQDTEDFVCNTFQCGYDIGR